jgi:hypothetical protein
MPARGDLNATLTILVLHPLTISRASRGREDVVVRRVASSFFAPSLCAIVAVLAAAHAFAQPASRQTGGLRPALEDTDDLPRSEAERNARKRTKRSSGASEQGQITSYGNPPGFGASKTGFVSTNTKRRAAPALRKGARPQSTSTATQPAPLSLTPPGVSATAGLPTSTPATVVVSSNRSVPVTQCCHSAISSCGFRMERRPAALREH